MSKNDWVNPQIVIREYIPDQDKAFIISSWLHSYKNATRNAEVSNDVYFQSHHKIIEKILERGSSLLATSDDDADLILGYLTFEENQTDNIIHYVYVKRAFNGLGICQQLFKALPFQITRHTIASHITRSGRHLVQKLGLTYCPYAQ